ncbi:MAG: SAM-dependent DNA methyltransferase [Spirochaetes bacterium]|nr:SAM-dependent DNA methyltransferase [Spirochaetota bacterium]
MKRGRSRDDTVARSLSVAIVGQVGLPSTSVSVPSFITDHPIGEVNTPLPWAVWAAERYRLIDSWMEGATVLDPTMGEGNLLEAFLYGGLMRGIPVEKLPVHTLFGIERRGEKIRRFFQRVLDRYHLKLPEKNFIEADILTGLQSDSPMVEKLLTVNTTRIPPADILFGNPPWITFASLPDVYKNQIKDFFLRYSLIKNRNQALLGRSRVDLSALIVFVAISRFLRTGGKGVFFLPLSLFFGEGAGEGFRRFCSEGVPFSVQELVELSIGEVFPRVSTRSCLVYLKRNEVQRFPVPVYRKAQNRLSRWKASPIDGPESSWILYQEEHPFPKGVPRIPIPSESVPRQGINTCGANDLFFFDSVEIEEEGVWRVSNATLTCLLPSRYLFPLLTSESFCEKEPLPHKWVFLPYQLNGQPLSFQQIEEDPYLKIFMSQHRERLKARKGVMIQRWIRKGYFWALFGVGAYCFYPWKIVWEAAGRKKFFPTLWKGEWQANQSLFGYLPFQSLQEATRVLQELQHPWIETYLLALQAQGTLNWAQPGRMKRLFSPIPTQGTR